MVREYVYMIIVVICATITIEAASSIVTSYAGGHPESYYQEKWCNARGQIEVVLSDRTRADCLTNDGQYAVEVEFGRNWAEAIGQSLHYAKMTGRQAGIVLIVDNQRYLDRLNGVIDHHELPITVWEIKQ